MSDRLRPPAPNKLRTDPDAYLGPYRQVRKGEIVDPTDVTDAGTVPQRVYGGRRKLGPLPQGVNVDRRSPKSGK